MSQQGHTTCERSSGSTVPQKPVKKALSAVELIFKKVPSEYFFSLYLPT